MSIAPEQIEAARARVSAYIERHKKMRGIDPSSIHGFDMGPDGGVELTVADIEALLSVPVAAKPVPVGIEPELFDIEQSREYLVQFMEQSFTDKTYHRYIRGASDDRSILAGDFAWQMARALRMLEQRLWCAEVNEDGAREHVAELQRAAPQPEAVSPAAAQEPVGTVKITAGKTWVHWESLPIAGMKLFAVATPAIAAPTEVERDANALLKPNRAVVAIMEAIAEARPLYDHEIPDYIVALRADVLRYRWLRKKRNITDQRNTPWCVALDPAEKIPTLIFRAELELDQAIDAAIATGEKK